MKKKILFMLINMNVGGTEKALLNMIAEMPKEDYDITLLMLEEYGGFLSYIPDGVKVEHVKGYKNIKGMLNNPPLITAKELLKQGHVVKSLNIFILHILTKITNNKGLFFNYLLKNQPVLKTEYDIAVAYAGPVDFISYFVVQKIKARKKIQWIHFDITKIGFDQKFVSKIYKEFDKIFVVSKQGKEKFVGKFPLLKDKVKVFYNIISPNHIKELAEQGVGFKDNFKGIRILTVGRLSKEKGQDLCIPVLAKLKTQGYNIKWYCIGDGSARKEYEQVIKQYDLENDFILLGTNPNPYPFMKECDIYVQPSRHEGYCITLAEARCFKTPIITTNFTGAKEQIQNGKTGIIVDPEETELYSSITNLFNNQELCNTLVSNLEDDLPNMKPHKISW